MSKQLETGVSRISASRAVFGLGLWQAVWMFVFAFAISTVYDNYAVVDLNKLSEGMRQFLAYDARFIAASFFLRASVCFLISASDDTKLQRRTLIFWSFFNFIPLSLVIAYANIFDNNFAFYVAVGIPCLEASILSYLGWIACKPKAVKSD